MSNANPNDFPEWLWGMIYSSSYCSMQYDESHASEDVWEAFYKFDDRTADEERLVMDFLRTCKPIQAHHFLHCAGHYEATCKEWSVVLRRPDCDQATALMYVAYFSQCYSEGETEWLDEDVKELMSYIRTRAWKEGFKVHGFDLSEAALLEMSDMRKTFVNKKDHPYSLPAKFLLMSKKEQLFHKLCDKFKRPQNFTH